MDDAAEEERLLRAITRKPAAPAPKVISPRPPDNVPKIISPRPPEERVSKVISPRGHVANPYAEQLETLISKKSTVATAIFTTKRDLDEIRVEIEKLRSKEADLLVLLEKREAAHNKLSEEIVLVERAAKGHVVEKKKEEKKDTEADELKRRSSNPPPSQSHSSPSSPKPDVISPRVTESDHGGLYQGRVSSVYSLSPQEGADNELSPEEARLMRAVNRKSLAPGVVVPGAPITKAQTVKMPERSSHSQAAGSSWKEQERAREADRAARLAEESRKKEEARKATLDREVADRRADENRVSAIQNREGKLHTFTSPVIYDFDAEVKICGDFTDWREIPLTTPLNDNFTYSITFPLSSGPHFYRFKIDGKWELNKNQVTGVATTGDVMNKIEI